MTRRGGPGRVSITQTSDTMFQFIHAADVHLDSPLKGLQKYEGAPADRIRTASREAFRQLVETAIDRKVRFVLLAGDLYDGDWPDFNTGLFFNQQMALLKEAEIPVYLIRGNHDAANRMTRNLHPPENVYVFRDDHPETFELDDVAVAIHGQSFATQAVTEDLSKAYPPPRPGMLNIGLLHTSADGREGHATYAPCTPAGLVAKGYDYWALGHIHQREVLHESPYIVFSGNIQGRHIREQGAKGCYLCTVNDDRSISLEFQPLDVFRWDQVAVDAAGVETFDQLSGQVSDSLRECVERAEGRPLAVRMVVHGETPLHDELLAQRERHTNEVRSIGFGVGRGDLWIEKVKFATSLPRVMVDDEISADDPSAVLNDIFAALASDPALLKEYEGDLGKLRKKLPEAIREILPVDDDAWAAEIVAEASSLLKSTLQGGEAK